LPPAWKIKTFSLDADPALTKETKNAGNITQTEEKTARPKRAKENGKKRKPVRYFNAYVKLQKPLDPTPRMGKIRRKLKMTNSKNEARNPTQTQTKRKETVVRKLWPTREMLKQRQALKETDINAGNVTTTNQKNETEQTEQPKKRGKQEYDCFDILSQLLLTTDCHLDHSMRRKNCKKCTTNKPRHETTTGRAKNIICTIAFTPST